MKALMFGWEFPPHILGGLGTASYGLTKGMAVQKDMQITFVIPKPHGDEDTSFAFNRFRHIAFRWLCALTLLRPK